MTRMTKTLTLLAAVATFGLAAITTPQAAETRHHKHHKHFGIFIDVPFSPYYAYEGVDSDYYGGCYWTHQRVWDGWAWRLRRVQVCS